MGNFQNVQPVMNVAKEPTPITFEPVYTAVVKTKEYRQATNSFSYTDQMYTYFKIITNVTFSITPLLVPNSG